MVLASAVQPVLASSLLQPTTSEHGKNLLRIGCGSKGIDDALRGGLDPGHGGLTCITGEEGAGKTGLAFAFLVTFLLGSATDQAVLIDTIGTFDVLRLYNTILSQLRSRPDHAEPMKSQDPEATAAELLDRVKIMRVFDFLGMVEAVAEVREKLESQQRDLEREEEPQPEPEPAEPEMEQPQPRESSRNVKRIRSTIPDSEDEDESEDDDDVMLFDEVSGPLEEVVLQDISIEESEHARGVVNRDQKPKERVGMIMVDNITLVMSPMMKTNYVQASALLTSFLRSLSQVTKTHHLSTIVLNTATLVPSIPSSKARTLQHSRNHMKNPYASIFASAGHLQPALSPILPSHADLHLFITTQPLARQDAAAAASFSGSPSGDIVSGESESVSVLEVLSDRYADRTGRWAAFSWDNAGAIVGVDPQCGVAQKKYHLPGFASKIIL